MQDEAESGPVDIQLVCDGRIRPVETAEAGVKVEND
jgi:hypothetical protein